MITLGVNTALRIHKPEVKSFLRHLYSQPESYLRKRDNLYHLYWLAASSHFVQSDFADFCKFWTPNPLVNLPLQIIFLTNGPKNAKYGRYLAYHKQYKQIIDHDYFQYYFPEKVCHCRGYDYFLCLLLNNNSDSSIRFYPSHLDLALPVKGLF